MCVCVCGRGGGGRDPEIRETLQSSGIIVMTVVRGAGFLWKRGGDPASGSSFPDLSHLFFSMQVACRQLGFLGAKRFYTHGGGTGPTWLDDVNCRGTEKSLLECKHRGIGIENCGKVFKELKVENFRGAFSPDPTDR